MGVSAHPVALTATYSPVRAPRSTLCDAAGERWEVPGGSRPCAIEQSGQFEVGRLFDAREGPDRLYLSFREGVVDVETHE